MKTRRYKKVLLSFLAVGMFTSTAACTTQEILNRTTGAVIGAGVAAIQSLFLTTAEEVRIGQQIRQQILAETPVYTGSSDLTQYVNNLGQQIAAQSERKDEINYQFNIIQSNEINAFAAPGGFIFITTEALKYIRSEAELVAVLGHEMGHVDKKHGVEGIKRAMIAQGLAQGALTEADSQIVQAIAGFTLDLILKGYGREQEKESDRVGTDVAAALNYDATAMTDFLDTILQLNGDPDGLLTFLTTHPPSQERIDLIKARVDEKNYNQGSTMLNKDEYLQKISVLPPKVPIQSGS